MASTVLHLLGTFHQHNVIAYDSTSDLAWDPAVCPHCGASQLLRVAVQVDGDHKAKDWSTRWLRCVSCLRGSVIEDEVLYPAGKPLRTPLGLPPIDGMIWEEARACLGVGANAAAVMLCRKLLFHIAVANGLPPKDSKDRAPSFTEAVKHLEGEGLVTKKMLPWVERIKDVGNEANHELSPITADLALDVATFTEQLLVLAYELDALMADPHLAEASPAE